jgi:hypothetical protein
MSAKLEKIVKVLNSISDSKVFYSKWSEVCPKVLSFKVAGKTIPFKITPKLASELIGNAALARFGRKNKTLKDSRIRQTWEIPASKIKISKEWGKKLNLAMMKIKKDLDLPENYDLSAELHNLLIYEKDHHFKSHQDSEKTEGMLGTLVVLLPSTYSGGDFVIDHQGKKKVFKTSASSGLQYLAFYADCQHQVKKVTKGFRVAFTYNLVFKPAKIEFESQNNKKLTEAIDSYFENKSVDRFVYLLDHQYTEAGISWNFLKGADRKRVAALLGTADELNLTAGLALAEFHECWDAYSEDNSYWNDGWGEEDDEDSDESSSSDDYKLQELIESDISFKMIMNRNGKKVRSGDFVVDEDEICFTKSTENFDPFSSEYEPYMGNYGNTLDRWYRRAALVLERKKSKMNKK